MGKKQPSEPDREQTQPTEEEAMKKAENEVEDQADALAEESASEPEELCEEDRLRQQVEQLEDKVLRTVAEFENYKKRVARQYENTVRSANDSIIVELLEIVDNFERALDHSDEDTDLNAFRKGTELIFNQMVNLLKKYDITPIEAVGQPFDPNLHEAMMQIDSDEFEDGIVALEMAKGYRQGQRVIRHSRVGVSTGMKKED